jgi:chemotaxis signal transduction protein/ABC-type nitrate/sulfonate/bicarbonate transport system substrate-binding protein/CheY-like chemotaxis protein
MTMDPSNITILLVEDAAVMRKIELKTLKSLGFDTVIEAADGEIAVAKLQKNEKIDLIISDWNMPNKDGYELLVWVRGEEKYKHIPFLMATGQGEKKQEKKAVEAGVSSFVAKPFNQDELNRKIEEALGVDREIETDVQKVSQPKITDTGKVRLNVAHIQITDHLILGVLKHLIEKKEMTPRYFELETHCMSGWNPVQEALEKGSVDAAFILAPIAMDLFNFGIPIKLTLLAHKSGSIFVRGNQDDYCEPYADFFRQKTFLIPHKLSVHHMLAHMFFKGIGLKAGMVAEGKIDVNFEVTAPIKMPEFLGKNPNACGFMVAEPIGTKAIAQGVAKLQFLSGELWENHPCCVVAMREDFIGPYTDAVYEFTEMLVGAGKFIENKPEMAAEIAVNFLDPKKQLGLKVPILKNVLTETRGIKSGDLFPVIEDLDRMQQYMYHNMGIGSIIDLEKFVDTRFAEAACKDRVSARKTSVLHAADDVALEILNRTDQAKESSQKAMLSKEGKYLSYVMGNQEFGIDILKIKEIIAMIPIRSLPQAPPFVKGVINLRGRVIPVLDLRLKFGMEETEFTERSCIIVLELEFDGTPAHIGIAVDKVSEVLDIKASEIEATPSFGVDIDTSHLLAMATMEDGVKILLDIDNILSDKEMKALGAVN